MKTKLGLKNKTHVSWALYDWANSAFATTIMVAVFPVFYAEVAGATLPKHLRTAYWGYTAAIALLVVSLLAPFLGALADRISYRKRLLAFFALLGSTASGALYFIDSGQWTLASFIYILANIGFALGNVFYNSLLPFIANERERDQVSTAGYAIGYLGGGILLAVNLLMIQKPGWFGIESTLHATQLTFVSVGIWWAVFALPILNNVEEPYSGQKQAFSFGQLIQSYRKVFSTFGQIKQFKNALLFLVAFWLFNDGVSTIMKMATIYGKEVGIGTSHLIGAVLLVNFIGIPCTFFFGYLATQLGPKKGIAICLWVYIFVCVLGYFMTHAWHFWVLATCVGMVQGGVQALSRSLFASLLPPERASEFFGFYGLSDKLAGVIGPLLFGLVASFFESGRYSILFLITFFVVGLLLLSRVKEPSVSPSS